MATFYYRAADSKGRTQSGKIDANDRLAAIRLLRGQSLIPTEISLSDKRRFQRWLPQRATPRAINSTTLSLFLQQLASLLSAGLRLDTAIATLATGAATGAMTLELQRLQKSISDGRSFSQALSTATVPYPDFVIKLVSAGERSGNLSSAISRSAALLTRTLVLKQKLISALIYPALLICAGIATALVVVTFVLPKFTPIFQQSQIELPLSTRILMRVSEAVTVSALPVALMLIAAFFWGRQWRRSHIGRLRSDRVLLRLPLIGGLIQLSEISRVNVALEELVSGGVALTDALDVVQDIPANRSVRAALQRTATRVRAGDSLTKAISVDPIFPQFMIQVVHVAEEIGNLPHGFREVGRYMDAELQRKLDRLLTILTPLITLLMGGMVAMIIVSVLSAVLKLNELAF